MLNDIATIIFIGIALSMDAFSLSLAIGTIMDKPKKQLLLTILVGILHFLMPIIGTIIGGKIVLILNISMQILICAILTLIAFIMLSNVISTNKKDFNLSYLGILILAISVSFDSFSIGMGIRYFTYDLIFSGVLFALFSASFTYLGLRIGRYAKRYLDVVSNVIGALILIIIALISLCK